MAGEVKLAIILTASMQGGQAFNQAGGGIKGIGAAAKAAVPMLAAFAAYAAFEFLKDSIKIAVEFEQVMAEAGSIVGKTADEMKGLSNEIREMSKEIPKSPRDLGTALYDIFSAGITDSAEAMNALELSAKTASAGLTETATAAKAGISTMNAFGMEAAELEHIFDVQFLTIKFGILRYEELASVVGQLSPSAKAAGQSMESMFATLAILTKKGLNAAEASTALARAMDGLTKPAAIRAAAELGISFVEMTSESIIARDEFLRQKTALDELSNSYVRVEGDVKSLGEEMAKVSLEEAKNRLEIAKIRREAEKEGRDISEAEANRIAEIEDANADLTISYSEMSVAQQEARIQSTDLNNAMEAQKIATEGAQKAFDEQIAATGNFRPLVDIVEEIGEKYGHLGEAARADIIGQMFPQIRARRAILAIMGSEEELIAITDEMTDTAGAMGEAYAINTDTAAAGAQLMQNSMEDLKIEIGDEMMPVMEQWNEILRDDLIPMIQSTFIPILESMMPVIRQIAEVVGHLGRLFADYPELLWLIIGAMIALKVAQIAVNIAMASNPIGLIIIAAAGLIALIILMVKHWDEISAAFQRVGDAFKSAYDSSIGPTVEAIKGAIADIIEGWSWLGDLFNIVMASFASAYDTYIKPPLDFFVIGIMLLVDSLQGLWDMIVKVGQEFDKVFGPINEAISGTGEFIGGLGEGLGGVLGFADGGIVTEPTLALIGEAGSEAVIPLKDGAVPVDIIGGAVGTGTGIETHDTYNLTIQTGVLPEQETPESLADKITQALTEAKMRGATGG
ncbi:MAG: phage tail tape measure protein [Candidatus Thorarchaeota archaeon]